MVNWLELAPIRVNYDPSGVSMDSYVDEGKIRSIREIRIPADENVNAGGNVAFVLLQDGREVWRRGYGKLVKRTRLPSPIIFYCGMKVMLEGFSYSGNLHLEIILEERQHV